MKFDIRWKNIIKVVFCLITVSRTFYIFGTLYAWYLLDDII